MARTPTEEGLYIKAIEKMLSEGAGINEITATKLQKIVGGKYSRISRIVEEFKESYKAKETAGKESPKPVWFKEMLQGLTASIEKQVSDKWLVISEEINKTIALSVENFEDKRLLFESQKEEDRRQIEELETKNEELENELKKIKLQIKDEEKLKVELEVKNKSLEETKTNFKKDITELKKELKALQKENTQLNKSLSNIEGQLKTKDDILEEKERIIKILEDKE